MDTKPTIYQIPESLTRILASIEAILEVVEIQLHGRILRPEQVPLVLVVIDAYSFNSYHECNGGSMSQSRRLVGNTCRGNTTLPIRATFFSKRFSLAIRETAQASEQAPLVQALQTLRGVKDITAITLVAEIGSFERFPRARDFMGYTGLVPSEGSSGITRRLGGITKTGNRHVRRVLIESAWSYRYRPSVQRDLKKRQVGQSPEVRSIAWKAQTRLHGKYRQMMMRSKPHGKVVTAIARELAGFVWDISRQVEKNRKKTSLPGQAAIV